jgi:hypothetical protein
MPSERRYHDERLLEEIRRVAALIPDGPVTKAPVEELSEATTDTMTRRFGSWREALTAAGLGHRYGGRSVTATMRAQLSRRLSDEEIFDGLRRVARVVGSRQITRLDVRAHSTVLVTGWSRPVSGRGGLRSRRPAWSRRGWRTAGPTGTTSTTCRCCGTTRRAPTQGGGGQAAVDDQPRQLPSQVRVLGRSETCVPGRAARRPQVTIRFLEDRYDWDQRRRRFLLVEPPTLLEIGWTG